MSVKCQSNLLNINFNYYSILFFNRFRSNISNEQKFSILTKRIILGTNISTETNWFFKIITKGMSNHRKLS